MPRITKKQARQLGIEPGPTKNKYHSKKAQVDGITFDSKKEARKYEELKLLKRAGEIKDFFLQPEFELLPGFRARDGRWVRPIKYRADFRVINLDGSEEIIDTKGHRTKEYQLKKKLLLYSYPEIVFREE